MIDNELLQNKRYDKTSACQKIVFYDSDTMDREAKLIPLDIDKRANKFELRYRLELSIPNKISASSHQSHVSSSYEAHYKATRIEKIRG